MRRFAVLLAAVALASATLATPASSAVVAAESLTPAAPPYGAEPVPAGDGPVIVSADPFTLDAAGLVPGQIEMTTVSTRPSLVSGNRVRLEVRGVLTGDTLHLERDGVDVGAALAPLASRPGTFDGVVGDLHVGSNLLVATVSGEHGVRTASLVVVDHPLDGPVISGAHQQPFICETVESGMGAPTTPNCDAPTQLHWYARSAVTQQFSLLADPYAAYPPDTATATAGGRSEPFVVRIESSVINRSITRIAVLDDPHARGSSTPFTPSEWSSRLLYVFGEFCGPGYHQGVFHETDVLGDPRAANDQYAMPVFADLPGHLGQGYMVTISSLTTLAVNCNPLVSAETAMMVKEHIVDDYGLISHTIGVGGSGGAIQQHTTANMYPGVIDAATPMLSFPDMWNPFMTVLDCHVLEHVFAADPTRWTPAKQQAVTGLATPRVCQDWDTTFTPMFDPTNCSTGIPAADRYDPRRNPHGVRCDIQESQRVIWGVDAATGFANRPLDNVGVQYGLDVLQQGLITLDDFINLNVATGGMDIDAKRTVQRTTMPPVDAGIAFATGEENGRGAIDQIPIIDLSVPPVDVTPTYGVHDQNRPFETRARLDAAFGTHGNQAIWSGASSPGPAIDVAELWLEALDSLMVSNPGLSRADAVARSRPVEAADQCRALVTGVPGPCDQGVLRRTSPRQVAGGPLAEDVIKCQLRPIVAADYPPNATTAQLGQLRAIFSDGVCDWTKPSVGATARSRTWLSWGSGQPGVSPVTVPYPLVRSSMRSSWRVAAQSIGDGGVVELPTTATDRGYAAAALPFALIGMCAAIRRRRRTA
jgi:hypothetical protein